MLDTISYAVSLDPIGIALLLSGAALGIAMGLASWPQHQRAAILLDYIAVSHVAITALATWRAVRSVLQGGAQLTSSQTPRGVDPEVALNAVESGVYLYHKLPLLADTWIVPATAVALLGMMNHGWQLSPGGLKRPSTIAALSCAVYAGVVGALTSDSHVAAMWVTPYAFAFAISLFAFPKQSNVVVILLPMLALAAEGTLIAYVGEPRPHYGPSEPQLRYIYIESLRSEAFRQYLLGMPPVLLAHIPLILRAYSEKRTRVRAGLLVLAAIVLVSSRDPHAMFDAIIVVLQR